ncbi:MAG: hypothetical protein HY316_00605 [Acidobacteria bacterium]|nr:hypothetical protein [Acidobacteriota bacterium]
MRAIRILVLTLFVVGALSAGAAVKKEEKTQVQFTGLLGAMSKMFGGKATKEGITDTVTVQGNRKSTMRDDGGQIIDLDEEKIYDVNLKGKSYQVTTFEEIRRKFAEDQAKAKKEMAKMKDAPPPQEAPPENQMEFDFSIQDSGQKKAINGYDCKEVVVTIGAHEKGKKLEDSGGMVTAMNIWLTPKVAALKEIDDFDLRYFKQLALPFDPAMAQQMAAMMAANPYLMQSMGKVKEEAAKLDGTAVLTTTSFQTVASKQAAAEMAEQQKEEESNIDIPVGGDKKSMLGGMLGGLAKKAIQKKAEPKEDPNATPGRSTLMTSTTELLKVSSAVADADVAIPAGFKEKN